MQNASVIQQGCTDSRRQMLDLLQAYMERGMSVPYRDASRCEQSPNQSHNWMRATEAWYCYTVLVATWPDLVFLTLMTPFPD